MSLRALVDEIADVNWRDPAWWALLGVANAAEAWASLRGVPPTYLSSDAEPHGDTFMGWHSPAPATLAEAIADATTDAEAAARALTELDGALPDQPLRVAIRAGTSSSLVPADPSRIALVVGDRITGAADGAIVAVVGDHPIGVARHLHRRAWTRTGGPWLGIGRAGDLTIVSTCHLVVDGFGHAEICRAIINGRDPERHARVLAEARAIHGDAPIPALPPLAAAPPLDIAHARVASLPRFAPLAYAVGKVLYDGGRMSPTIQVPVAPGAPNRRVVTALVSVRFPDGAPEPLEVFTARAHAAIKREAAGGGLLSRLLAATAALPVPLSMKRHGLVGQRSSWLAGPIGVLGGRASLSILREPSLVAVSAPGVAGASVITVAGDVVTVAAERGAAALLSSVLSSAAASRSDPSS